MDYKNKYYKYKIKYLNLVGGALTNKQKTAVAVGATVLGLGAAAATAWAMKKKTT